MSSAGVEVPIRVNVLGAGQAADQVADIGANWDQVGLQGARAARSLTSGLSGLLSAEQNIYNAQQRVNVANINYVLTVREYGQGSIQAERALISLRQAQQSVAIAQDQLTLRFVQFALTTGPQIYTAISRMIASSMGMTLANYQETASWYAKAAAIGLTLGLLTAGIAVFGGLMSSATINNNIQQSNTFTGTGQTNANTFASFANQQLTGQVSNGARP